MTEQLKQSLIKERFRKPDEFVGCTDEEIQYIMRDQHVNQLPAIFVEYLKVMGHKGVAELFVGDDMDYESMIGLKKQLLNLIVDEGTGFVLPDDAFVFFTHHGDIYRYFLTGNNNANPAVFVYSLGDTSAKIGVETFSDYLNGILQVFRNLRNKRSR